MKKIIALTDFHGATDSSGMKTRKYEAELVYSVPEELANTFVDSGLAVWEEDFADSTSKESAEKETEAGKSKAGTHPKNKIPAKWDRG
jgi:hypothetical protein